MSFYGRGRELGVGWLTFCLAIMMKVVPKKVFVIGLAK